MADRHGAVVERLDLDRARELGPQAFDHGMHGVRDPDGVGAGLALDGEHDRPFTIEPTGDPAVLRAIHHLAQVSESNECAILGLDHQLPELAGALELAVGTQGVGLVRPVKHTGRQVDVPVRDGVRDLVDADAPRREELGVELDAHRVLLRPEHLHLCDALDGREPLRQRRLRILVQLGKGQHVAGERHEQDGGVGRIRLAVGRRQRALG